MKAGQLWSNEFGCPVSKAFFDLKENLATMIETKSNKIKVELTKCYIKISRFGMFELWYNEKKLRTLSFNEYLKYRDYVIRVEGLENVN